MKKWLTDTNLKFLLVFALVGLAIWSRFVPHPANFTALTAVALFGGAMLPRYWGVAIPLSAMIVSDLFIGLHSLSFVVWMSFMLMTFVGSYLKTHLNAINVVFASLAGSTLFYIITNFAVWAEGRMYAMNFGGLLQSYVNAIPFYRNMLVGDLLYVGVLFGAYAAIAYGVRRLLTRHNLSFSNY
jgi:hypothetical protein